ERLADQVVNVLDTEAVSHYEQVALVSYDPPLALPAQVRVRRPDAGALVHGWWIDPDPAAFGSRNRRNLPDRKQASALFDPVDRTVQLAQVDEAVNRCPLATREIELRGQRVPVGRRIKPALYGP